MAHLSGVLENLAMRLMCCLQLLDTSAVGVRREKMYQLDDHVACAVAGITGICRSCSPITTCCE